MEELEELYLETEAGRIPIEPEMISKYHLKKGNASPFTNYKIVGKDGDSIPDVSPDQSKPVLDPEENPGDGIVQMENGILLSTSEMIDIAQGADSANE